MNLFEAIWITLVVAGVVVETVALANHKDGDTLSENLREWFRINDKRPTVLTWILRSILLLGCLWFVPHIFLNWPW